MGKWWLNSLADKPLPGLVHYQLHGIGPNPLAIAMNVVSSVAEAIKILPWFYRVPIRIAFVFIEFGALLYSGKCFSQLDYRAQNSFLLLLARLPGVPSLFKLIRVLSLLSYFDACQQAETSLVESAHAAS